MADERERIAIPLVEERLRVEARSVETGRVHVRTVTETREEIAAANLERDKVEIERVPRDEEVSAPPPVREEGDVTIVPVVEERLVVTKKLFLVEEIRLRRKTVVEREEMPVTVRAQRAVVQRARWSGKPSKSEGSE
jgi:uncharacterized protein (TIGR02271 family)